MIGVSLAISLFGDFGSNELQRTEFAMQANLSRSIWQLIDELAAQLPFDKSKVGAILQTEVVERTEASNDAFQFFRAKPVELSDGVRIADIDLRTKRTGNHPGLLSLELTGRCVTLVEARRHYPGLTVTATPSGESPYELISMSSSQPWGRLSFGVDESPDHCLVDITFRPEPLR